MTITYEGNKVYFVYRNLEEAQMAFLRLVHLTPKYCSRGGHLNALCVDMSRVEPMGVC